MVSGVAQLVEQAANCRLDSGPCLHIFQRLRIKSSSTNGAESGTSVPLYRMYRVNLEHPGIMSSEQLEEAIGTALEGL
jgi:hypothetical protein